MAHRNDLGKIGNCSREKGFGICHGQRSEDHSKCRICNYSREGLKGQWVEEAGFLFEFSITPVEALQAKRRVQYFRLGLFEGVAVQCVLVVFFVIVPVVALTINAASAQDFDPGYFVPLIMALVVLFALGISTGRGITVHSRPIGDMPSWIFVGERSIQILNRGRRERRYWTEFTALESTNLAHIIYTQKDYIAIPRRVVSPEWESQFVIFTRGKCLKQGKSYDFPVVMNVSAETGKRDE
ncbi:MAG TPA: hypothetical protein VGN88_03820 [Phycisphaerae bacterium]